MSSGAGTGARHSARNVAANDLLKNRLRLRVQAHCQSLSADIGAQRPDQIRNRLAYIVANVNALLDEIEDHEP